MRTHHLNIKDGVEIDVTDKKLLKHKEVTTFNFISCMYTFSRVQDRYLELLKKVPCVGTKVVGILLHFQKTVGTSG